MIQATFRPLQDWPQKPTPHFTRQRAPFRQTYGDTLCILDREISKLNGRNVVIEIETDASQIRNDGLPRSDARVRGPKVAVYFDSKHGPLVYRCDDCMRWQDNLRAIAMTLERLRLADLYGVTKGGEQYRGFKALPGGIEVGPAAMTVEEAATALANLAGEGWRGNVCAGREQEALITTLYRQAVKKHHPDAGGDPGMWQRLQEAMNVLRKYHNL